LSVIFPKTTHFAIIASETIKIKRLSAVKFEMTWKQKHFLNQLSFCKQCHAEGCRKVKNKHSPLLQPTGAELRGPPKKDKKMEHRKRKI